MRHLPGKFIVFDGPEGCGKSTQTKLLKSRLEAEGMKVSLFRDPGSTRIGESIRNLLLDPANDDMAMRCEMLLYMAARAQMMKELILPALTRNDVVLCDRFVSSTLAYQLHGDGLSADDIRNVANIAITGRWPDLTLVLDVPLEISSKRVIPKFMLPLPEQVQRDIGKGMTKDRIEQRPDPYHEQVRQNYLAQAQSDPARYHVIDASKDKDTVAAQIWTVLNEKFA
jgi:dTMP kinase